MRADTDQEGKMNRKPLTDKHMLDLVKAGATITPSMWGAGKTDGITGMIEAGLILHASYLGKMPKATCKKMGFNLS